jgi:hypothetical protein
MRMFRPSASPRRVLGLVLALSVGTGVGLGASHLWSAPGGPTPPDLRAVNTASAPPGPEGLTLDEAMAVAAGVAPGKVVEVDEDREPTGLRYDVTLLHEDGSATQIEVDAATGQVVSTQFDNDWDGS